MQRSFVALAAALALAAAASPAQAGDFFNRIARDFKRNNCWPDPFLQPDRVAARAPFALMVANGWRLQNTLSDHHFNAETAQLNEAGHLKVREILTEAPSQFRTLFVLRGLEPELTAIRIQSVESAAEEVTMDGETPTIVEVSIKPRGWAADDIDATGRKYRASMPDPRLPERASGGQN